MQFDRVRAVQTFEATSENGTLYRRTGVLNWAELMGEGSWETIDYTDHVMELEQAFSKWVSLNGPPQ
jgi:hypothetical protein